MGREIDLTPELVPAGCIMTEAWGLLWLPGHGCTAFAWTPSELFRAAPDCSWGRQRPLKRAANESASAPTAGTVPALSSCTDHSEEFRHSLFRSQGHR